MDKFQNWKSKLWRYSAYLTISTSLTSDVTMVIHNKANKYAGTVRIHRRTKKIRSVAKSPFVAHLTICGANTKPLSTKNISTATIETISICSASTDRSIKKWQMATVIAATPRNKSRPNKRCSLITFRPGYLSNRFNFRTSDQKSMRRRIAHVLELSCADPKSVVKMRQNSAQRNQLASYPGYARTGADLRCRGQIQTA